MQNGSYILWIARADFISSVPSSPQPPRQNTLKQKMKQWSKKYKQEKKRNDVNSTTAVFKRSRTVFDVENISEFNTISGVENHGGNTQQYIAFFILKFTFDL